MNKKTLYIALFIVLGILLAFIVHGLLEIWYVNRLLENFPKYSLGYTWVQLFRINNYIYMLLFVAGILFGNYQGRFWWRIVYEEKRLDPFFRRLKKFLGIKA
jgi:hypothetical protein